MQRISVLSLSLMILLGSMACGGSWEKRYRLEHSRLLHAERHIGRTATVVKGLQRTVKQHQRRFKQLEREVRVMRVQLGRSRQRLRQCLLKKKLTVSLRPHWLKPYVAVGTVRLWQNTNRKRRARAATELRTLLPRWRKCYRTFGGGRPKEPTLQGSFWLVYGARRNRVVGPRILHSTIPMTWGRDTVSKRLYKRARQLENCFRRALTTLRPKSGRQLLRIAARINVAGSWAGAITKNRLTWPWKRVKRTRSGMNQVCRVGRRRLQYDALVPSRARPCKTGLKCCYPCGIRDCNWICLRRCPRGLP